MTATTTLTLGKSRHFRVNYFLDKSRLLRCKLDDQTHDTFPGKTSFTKAFGQQAHGNNERGATWTSALLLHHTVPGRSPVSAASQWTRGL